MATQDADQVMHLKDELYDACKSADSQTVFSQNELLDHDVIPGEGAQRLHLLLAVTQRLCDEKLFKLVRQSSSSAGWMVRSRDDAAKYVNLTNEQEMVYGLIDDAGAEGIWSKTIKTRLNMHDTTMRTALKHLEAKRLITDMKSVEHLNRKMYIKASLTPSEKATGGAWYTDGELDEGMLNSLTGVLYAYIHSKSFYWSRSSAESSARPAKRVKTGSGLAKAPTTAEAKSLRDAALKSSGPHVKEEDTGRFPWTVSFDNMLPFPAGYQGYPTIGDITTLIEKEGISPTTLTKEDVEQLLEVLCFDDKIEKIKCGNGEAYRALRKSNTEVNELKGPMNGLTEAPCGRCPVFDLCEEGGTVSPSNCEYFTTWLGLDGW